MADSSISLREQIAVLFRHRGKMLAFFVGTMMLVTAGIIFCPRTYESEAKLHVLIGRESVGLDPTATTGSTINMMGTREHEINTVKDLLLSRALLDEVVEKLGAETILDPKPSEASEDSPGSSWMGAAHEWMVKVNLADPVSENERAVRKLATNIKISSEPESNVICVACRSATPKCAQKIADVFLGAYHTQHSRAHRTQGSEEFFSEQTELLALELTKAEHRLRDTKSQHGIVTIGSNQLSLSKSLELVELDRLTTSVAITASEATIKMLEESLTLIPERLVTEETSVSNRAADEMRRTLYDLQIQQRALTAKHTDQHPTVLAIREQVAASQELLDAEEKEKIHPTSDLNPANQQQKLALLAEQARLAGLEAKYQALETQLSELQGKLVDLNEQEMVIAQIERQVLLLKNDYMAYSRSKELARIDQELDSQNISNVNVVQTPTLVEKPVSPPKAIIMILGLALATSGAIALALLSESLKAAEPLKATKEAALHAPVRDSIPQLQGVAATAK